MELVGIAAHFSDFTDVHIREFQKLCRPVHTVVHEEMLQGLVGPFPEQLSQIVAVQVAEGGHIFHGDGAAVVLFDERDGFFYIEIFHLSRGSGFRLGGAADQTVEKQVQMSDLENGGLARKMCIRDSYVSVSTVGTMGTDWANDTFVGGIQEAVTAALAGAGAGDLVTSLIVDGIIGGLGAVFGFLPQMAILFIFLSILEDCGYMVRIAFVMDRVFRHFGLSGKSFIPLLISSGCGIPGIMASRTIENDNDRRLTIMTATFVPCGAKLPVIALMGGLITGWATGDYSDAGSWAFIMYVIGVAAVLVSAIMLKKTKPFSGEAAPFVMELPAYHIPSIRTVAIHVWERLFSFIKKAGTILFLACVVMWVLSTFGFTADGFGMVEDSADSLMGVVGGFIAPLFHPLGWGVGEYGFAPVSASISGFSAKENIVTTIGILAGVAEEASEDAPTVAAAIRAWFPNTAAAVSFLV